MKRTQKKRRRRKEPWTKEMSESYTKALIDGAKKIKPGQVVAVHPTTKEDVING